MEGERSYGIASCSGASGALHVWLRRDGAPRRTQSGCKLRGASCMSSVVHRGHLFCACENASGSAFHICAHALYRQVGGAASRCSAPEPMVSALGLSPDGNVLVTGAPSGRCHMWSLSSATLLASWDAHFRSVSRIAFTDDSETVVTAGDDGAVHAFDVVLLADHTRDPEQAPRPVVSLHGHSLPVAALAVGFGGASARVLTASMDRVAKVWHLSSAQVVGSILLSSRPSDAAITADESRIFVGTESGTIIVASPSQLRSMQPVPDSRLDCIAAPPTENGAVSAVTSLAVSPLGSEIVAGYDDGTVRIYDVALRVVVMSYTKHGDTPITWVGVLFPLPDVVVHDAGGGKEGTAVAESLLYSGALAKVPETSIRQAYAPTVSLDRPSNVEDIDTLSLRPGCLDDTSYRGVS